MERGAAPVVRERVLQHEHRERQQQHPGAVGVGKAQPALSALRRPILPRQRHEQGSQLDRADAQGQDHVWRTEDLDVEPVGVVPPVVERRGGEHRDRAPDRHPGPQRRAKSPHAHRPSNLGTGAGKGRLQGQPSAGQAGRQPASVDCEVGWRPERVAPDRTVPRDVPDDPDDHARGREEDGGQVPGEVAWRVVLGGLEGVRHLGSTGSGDRRNQSAMKLYHGSMADKGSAE